MTTEMIAPYLEHSFQMIALRLDLNFVELKLISCLDIELGGNSHHKRHTRCGEKKYEHKHVIRSQGSRVLIELLCCKLV